MSDYKRDDTRECFRWLADLHEAIWWSDIKNATVQELIALFNDTRETLPHDYESLVEAIVRRRAR